MLKTVLLTAAAALLFSSPSFAGDSPGFDLNGLVRTAQTDLAAAKADADAHGDTIASQCYAGVSAYVTAHPISLPSAGSVKGVASGFQTARDAVKFAEAAQASAGIPPELERACGPLALDVQSDLGKAAVGFTFLGIKF